MLSISAGLRLLRFAATILPTLGCSRGEPSKAAKTLLDVPAALLDVELSQSTLAEVIARFNTGQIYQLGDGGDSRDRVCFTATNPGADLIAFFQSTSMSRLPGEVTAFGLSRLHLYDERERCSTVRLDDANPPILMGIRLGLSDQEIVSVLGTPQKRTNTRIEYLETAKLLMSTPEAARVKMNDPQAREPQWDVTVGVVGLLEEQRLAYIEVSRVVSY